jgi:hypothetical protein
MTGGGGGDILDLRRGLPRRRGRRVEEERPSALIGSCSDGGAWMGEVAAARIGEAEG